ncbi:MAG: shikimate dehydrogenase [Endomicrobiaceae bacterium]|nr:shikimate dehydrogenase [Endomicrobiaceae bacterium]
MQKKVTANTKLLGIFGNPVSHSLSPVMHNDWFAKYKLNNLYLAFDVLPKNLKSAVESIKTLNILGVNVTVPHKIEVMKYLDTIDAAAKAIGSVNTIVNKNGKLYGYNTDWQGFITDLKFKKVNLKNKTVLVIGAGGAAKAILYALTKLKVKKIFLTSRTFDKAKLVAEKYKNISVVDINEISEDFLQNIDCLVNCSTCGMKKEDKLPFTIRKFNKDIVFYDIIYNKETPFKKLAVKNKIKYFSGEGMLIYQGAVSFEKWTNIFPNTKNTLNLIKKFMR